MNVAIIPARGGSKRIPRKNIRLFHGKPIIAYSIENALQSKLFDAVVVSTDDEEIAQISKTYGAQVPVLRSEENATDHATTSDVLVEVISYFESIGESIQTACCLYPTVPLINHQDLIKAHKRFETEHFDVLLSCVRYSFPVERAFKVATNRKVELLNPDMIQKRSQDITPTFHDAGAFYYFNSKIFLKTRNLWSGEIGTYELPESRVQDIDEPQDWEMAELKYARLS